MSFESLTGHRFVLLTTYRRDDTPVSTPVWAVVHDGRAYVVSRGPGKVRRIGANPAVDLAPSGARGGVHGPPVAGTARILPEGLPDPVWRAFGRKYGPLPVLGRTVARLFRKNLVALEISPRSPATRHLGGPAQDARTR